MLLVLRTVFLGWITLVVLTASGRAAGNFDSDFTSPGWTRSDLTLNGEKLDISQTISDKSGIYAYLESGEVVRIDPATVQVTSLGNLPTRLDDVHLTLSGGCLLFSGINYLLDPVAGYAKQLTLDVLDLKTSQWKARKSILLGSAGDHLSVTPVPAVHRGEVRLILDSGKIFRWKLADMSELPSLVVPPDPNLLYTVLQTIIGTSVGDEFCCGTTYGYVGIGKKSQLVLEKNGAFRMINIPGSYYPRSAAMSSDAFIVLPVDNDNSVSNKPDGVLIWDKAKINQPARLMSYGSAHQYRYAIWENRFLARIPSYSNEDSRVMEVADLSKAGVAVMSIPLPAEYSVGKASGFGSGCFWTLDSPGAVGKPFHRLDVPSAPVLVSVDVASARAMEGEGKLKFRVSADRTLTSPVVVSLKTVGGSAKEGVDYVKYEGTVTLTPKQPVADVVVTILQDRELESYESMILEITKVTGAWKKRAFTTGVIEGSGFFQLGDISAPAPGANSLNFPYEWIQTRQGVVAKFSAGGSRTALYILRNGATAWQRLDALGTNDSFGRQIIDAQGDRIVSTTDVTDFSNSLNAQTLMVMDLSTGEILKTVDTFSSEAILDSDGLVTRMSNPPRLAKLSFGSSGDAWSIPADQGGSNPYFRISDKLFAQTDSSSGYQIRQLSDGSVTGLVAAGCQPLAVAGDFAFGSVNVGNYETATSIVNSSGTGYPYHGLGEIDYGYGGIPGIPALSDTGILFFDRSQSWNPRMDVVDCKTGAVLVSRPRVGGGPVSLSSGVLTFNETGKKLTRLSLFPRIPRLRETKTVRKEGENPQNWMVGLSEAADFPITATFTTTSGELTPGNATVTIPAGTASIPCPVHVKDDNIPENDQTVDLKVTLSGNGVTQSYNVSVLILANDFEYLKGPKNATEGSAIALHPSGILIGDAMKRGAVELRSRKVVQSPDPKSSSSFGQAVGLNSSYMVVGSPFLYYTFGEKPPKPTSFVCVYDRKTGKLVKRYDESTKGSSFGSVVCVTGNRFFVGAPGLAKGGVVTGYGFGKTAPTQFKHPNPNAGKTRFGTAIASKGATVWIGAPRDGRGMVYQYDVLSGKLRKTIKNPVTAGKSFGQAIAFVGTKIAISAPTRDAKAAVIIFDSSGKQLKTIQTPFKDGGLFGASLAALDETTLIVGCPNSGFSPYGGLLIYDISGSGYKLLSMLLPPKKPVDDPEWEPWMRGLGISGGLSSVDGVVGVAWAHLEDPLDVAEAHGLNDSSVIPYVALLDFSKYLSSPSKVKAAPMQLVQETTPWEKALGQGASDADCEISVTRGAAGISVTLPQIASLAGGAVLVLETSADMDEWLPAATISGAEAGAWKSLTNDVLIDKVNNQAVFAAGEGEKSRFFRIRCQVP